MRECPVALFVGSQRNFLICTRHQPVSKLKNSQDLVFNYRSGFVNSRHHYLHFIRKTSAYVNNLLSLRELDISQLFNIVILIRGTNDYEVFQ